MKITKLAGALSALAFSFLVSCSSVPVTQQLDPDVDYQQDPEIKVGNLSGRGIIVVPVAASYEVEISTPGNADVVHVQTCHRFFTSNEYPSGWFTDKKRYRFSYRPSGELEAQCIVHLDLFEANANQRHSSADIIPSSPKHSLPAKLVCNGESHPGGSSLNQGGTTACQSKAGFVQEIEFADPVDVASERSDGRTEPCELAVGDGKKFTFNVPAGRCRFEFQERKAPFRRHVLRTYGFAEAPWRNAK